MTFKQSSEKWKEIQGNTHKNGDGCPEQPTKNISDESSEDEGSGCQGVPLSKGQFGALIAGFFQFFEKYPHSDSCVCISCAVTKPAGITKIIKD